MPIPSTTKPIFPALIPIGYVQKTIGFKGHLQLQIDSPIKSNSSHPAFLWFLQYGKPVPFHVESYKVLNEQAISIGLEDIHDEQDAQALKGLSCFIEEAIYEEFFDSVESYDYLIGFSVVDGDVGHLGEVKDVLENDNGHDNLVVINKGQEVFIPFVDPIVTKVDEEAKSIHVELPEGLLDLYLK